MLVFDLDTPKPNHKYCEKEYRILILVPDSEGFKKYQKRTPSNPFLGIFVSYQEYP
jgi:hypothetical protein